MDTDKLAYTVNEVAGLIRCKSQNIIKHIQAGNLRAVNVGVGDDRPTWTVLHADLNEFLDARASRSRADKQTTVNPIK